MTWHFEIHFCEWWFLYFDSNFIEVYSEGSNWQWISIGWGDDLMSNKQDVITYRKSCNISRTLVGNKNVDQSDVVGALPVSAAPTTSSFST